MDPLQQTVIRHDRDTGPCECPECVGSRKTLMRFPTRAAVDNLAGADDHDLALVTTGMALLWLIFSWLAMIQWAHGGP